MAQTSDQGDSGQETNPSTSSNNADVDFDPSAQVLIDEIDDERTLEEEEALAVADPSVVQNELDDLKRESEMPIEELLAYYERMRNEAGANAGEEEEDEVEDDEECEDEDEEYEEDENCEEGDNEELKQRDEKPREIPLEEEGVLIQVDEQTQNIFRALIDNLSSSGDDDYSYSSDDEYDDQRGWRRVIHVGPEHQADVPDGLLKYENDLLPYENEDVLVWKCDPELSQEQILDFLKQASVIPKRNDISLSPASVPKISDHHIRHYRERTQDYGSASSGLNTSELNHENINNENPANQPDVYMLQSRKRLRIEHEITRDIMMDYMNQSSVEIQSDDLPTDNVAPNKSPKSDPQDNKPKLSTEEYFQGEEQLLYLLLQCNHNFKEALRRRTLDPFKYYISEPMSLWSQDECLGFEHGLRIYGKNFRLIRDNEVPTRTRAEVVAFYYLWKKSERHDVYTNQYKIDRKRCLTHPGTTDYMDKFIEDNESALNASTSTPSPTRTESTAENNQISQTSHLDSQPISICHSSGSGTPLAECLNLPADLSVIANYNEHGGDPNQLNTNVEDNTKVDP